MSKNSNAFLAFLAGAATGAIIGILYAPDVGKNTRDKLSFQLDKYKKKLEDLLSGEPEEPSNMSSNTARSQGEKIVKDAKHKAEQLLDDVNGLINKIRREE